MAAENPRPNKKRHLAVEERQRAVRACGECRRLKEKCEDGIPCKRCRHLRRPCEINAAPATLDKRAPDFTGSSKELMDRVRYMEFILKHHFPDLAMDTDSLRCTCDSLSSPTPHADQDDANHEPLEPTLTSQLTDSPGIEDQNCTIEYVDGTTAHYSGEFSHWNFSMHIKRNIDDIMVKSNAPSPMNVNLVPDFIRVGEADPNSSSISDIIAMLPPRPVANFLTNVFFKHATSIYYYVDRQWLDGILDRIYTNANELRSKEVTATCVVLMVLAVGTQYVHLESPEHHSRRRTDALASADNHSSWELDIGSAFYRQVAKLISEVIHAGSLLSVQVFLLLGLYSLPIDASGLGYIYLNLAIKVAIQNGMHRRVSRNVFDARTKEIRRRIWWTVYCMERNIGVYHGRPKSIMRSDIDTDLPQSSEANEMNDDTFNASPLLDSINLTDQADAFLGEITLLRTCSRSEVGTILNRIKHMKESLRGPGALPRIDMLSTLPRKDSERPQSRAGIHSQLQCCLLHIFIGRPFILAHPQLQDRVQPERSQPQAPESQMQWDVLVEECVAAAKDVIRLCHAMQTGGMGLAKSSYIEYSSCRASLLALIAYSVCYRTSELSGTLRLGLDAIKEMASVSDSARAEVSLIETLEAALHQLHILGSKPNQSSTPLTETSPHESYQGLLSWYTQLGGSATTRTRPSVYGVDGLQGAKTPTQEPAPPHDPAVNGILNDICIAEYPFDFDFLNSDGNAFFTQDFNDQGNAEKEVFENLLWVPR